MTKTLIRDESAADRKQITRVTIEAFADHPFSDHTEHLIIDRLRDRNELTLSLVAESNNRIIGHIAFSPVAISNGTTDWYGLGPISVDPAYQRQGIGSQLIIEGLARLRELGAAGCVVVGEPGFYEKFGFHSHPQLNCAGIPQEYFLSQSLNNPLPTGKVSYSKAFGIPS